MTERELLLNVAQNLEKLNEKVDGMKVEMTQRFDTVDKRFEETNEELAVLKEHAEITRETTNSLAKWAENVGVLVQVAFPIPEKE